MSELWPKEAAAAKAFPIRRNRCSVTAMHGFVRNHKIFGLLISALTTGSLSLLMGCHSKPLDVLHITAAMPDQPVDVEGAFNGKTYELSIDRTPQPMYVAYYEPIDTDAEGKDFRATLSEGEGALIVDVPGRVTSSGLYTRIAERITR